jgi:hypothetical protein
MVLKTKETGLDPMTGGFKKNSQNWFCLVLRVVLKTHPMGKGRVKGCL